eukprot:3301836-Rhodomonas_salina.1
MTIRTPPRAATPDETLSARGVRLKCSDGGTALAVVGILGVVAAWVAIAAATLHLASVDVLVLFMRVNTWITKCRQRQAASSGTRS